MTVGKCRLIAVFCIDSLWFVDSVFFVFFKQKTAYEMRISDWSSDVCSSDLRTLYAHAAVLEVAVVGLVDDYWTQAVTAFVVARPGEIGRASCRERVCQYV